MQYFCVHPLKALSCQVDGISLGSNGSCSSSTSSWQTGSRSWEEQAAPPSPAAGGQKSLSRVPDHPHLQETLQVAPLSPAGGGLVAPPSPRGDQKCLKVADHLHLQSSTCAFTPPPTPSPTFSARSEQLDVSFLFWPKKIH